MTASAKPDPLRHHATEGIEHEKRTREMTYHIAEQSKLTSIHLFGFMLNDFTY